MSLNLHFRCYSRLTLLCNSMPVSCRCRGPRISKFNPRPAYASTRECSHTHTHTHKRTTKRSHERIRSVSTPERMHAAAALFYFGYRPDIVFLEFQTLVLIEFQWRVKGQHLRHAFQKFLPLLSDATFRQGPTFNASCASEMKTKGFLSLTQEASFYTVSCECTGFLWGIHPL